MNTAEMYANLDTQELNEMRAALRAEARAILSMRQAFTAQTPNARNTGGDYETAAHDEHRGRLEICDQLDRDNCQRWSAIERVIQARADARGARAR